MSVLSGVTAISAATVLLSATPCSDWAVWGSWTAPNIRNGGKSQMSLPTPLVETHQLVSSTTRGMTWTDGTPTASATGNESCIYVPNYSGVVGPGIQFTAPADTNVRTLTVYWGAGNGPTQLVATLSDGSASALTIANTAPGSGNTSLYVSTITYSAASPNQTLTIALTQTSGTNTSSALQLQAASITVALTKTILLPVGTTQFIPPFDWTDDNAFEGWAPAGNGGTATTTRGGGSGGTGGYSKSTSVVGLKPGKAVTCAVPAGGSALPVWVGGTSLATSFMGANPGGNASGSAAGTAGSVTGAIGNAIKNAGRAGTANTTSTAGAGAPGASGFLGLGAAGVANSTTTGGAGGQGDGTTGGAGGAANTAGASNVEGGGGGGGGSATGNKGGNGGYPGGAGGGGSTSAQVGGTAAGAQIRVTYAPNPNVVSFTVPAGSVSFQTPPDWTDANKFEGWAPGGGGGSNTGTDPNYGQAGGGGMYGSVSNVAGLGANSVIPTVIGTGGIGGVYTSGSSVAGGNGADLSVGPSASPFLYVNGGKGGSPGSSSTQLGQGGTVTSSTVGTVINPGGNAGYPNTDVSSGGGAGGPDGPGQAGGTASNPGGAGDAGLGGPGGISGTDPGSVTATAGGTNPLGGGGAGAGSIDSNAPSGGFPGGGGGGGGATGQHDTGGGPGGDGVLKVSYVPGSPNRRKRRLFATATM